MEWTSDRTELGYSNASWAMATALREEKIDSKRLLTCPDLWPSSF